MNPWTEPKSSRAMMISNMLDWVRPEELAEVAAELATARRYRPATSVRVSNAEFWAAV